MAREPRVPRIKAFDRDVGLLVDQMLSAEARRARLAEIAREELAAAQRRNVAALGVAPKYDVIVDGRRGADVETVKADGTIVFEFQLIETALVRIAEMLAGKAPVRTGRFRDTIYLFADGAETDVNNPAPADEYAFVSAQPYARKIERGLSSKAPDGVFQVVAELAARRYGNLARIRFGYRSMPADAIGAWAQTASAKALARRVRGGNAAHHEDWLTRQPAVIIRAKG